MQRQSSTTLTRRAVLRAWLALPAATLLAACSGSPPSGPTQPAAAATPAPPTTPASTAATQPAQAPTAAVATLAASAQPTATVASQPAATKPPATAPPTTQAAPATASTQPASAPTATHTAAQVLAPTPACDDGDDDPTPSQTEGPYFTRNSPARVSLLEPGMTGTKLVIAGRILSTTCQPVARALLDFWQADDRGAYDNVGYRLRGHQFTDEGGQYRLETIVPGLYPGRTRHIHVKVQAPNRPVLTTQLYFPGEARNAADGIFRQELLVQIQDAADGKLATFDFVLNLA